MAEREEAPRAEDGQEVLEDLEAPDADVKGGGSSGAGGSTDPNDIRRQWGSRQPKEEHMAETERSQIPGAGADQASDELEDLEAQDADIKGGGVNGAGGSADPTGNERL